MPVDRIEGRDDRDPISAFRDAIAEAGLPAPDDIIADGRIHRFSTDPKRKSDTAGWYVLHLDAVPAGAFGDWRTGTWIKWAQRRKNMTNEERRALKERIQEIERLRMMELRQQLAAAKTRASALWENATLATEDHPYLRAKGIKPHGARVDRDGTLLIAARDASREIVGVQRILDDGTKRWMKGSMPAGAWFGIGRPGDVILVCEGFATGATLHEATGLPVAVAFTCGNLAAVAKAIREQHPEATILLCADDDHRTPGNPGVKHARAAAKSVSASIAVPDFGLARPDDATDFNDLARLRGIEAVRAQIDAVLHPPNTTSDGRRVINLADGELARIVIETVQAVQEAVRERKLELYQRGTQLVYPANAGTLGHGVVLVEPNAAWIRTMLARHLVWRRFDGRSESWRTTNPPLYVAQAYAAEVGRWGLPELLGFVEAPTLRPDGTLLHQRGYDPETRLLAVWPEDMTWPDLPEQPTLRDAIAAWKRLSTFFSTFPFQDHVDLAAALTALLTALLRRVLPTAPLFAVSAPVAGTGKSLLIDVIALIATGHPALVMTLASSPEEAEKRLATALMGGHPVINLDNLERPLEGELLCQVLTQEAVSLRVLGQSKAVHTPTNALLCATGNNLTIKGDMVRRAMLCVLDAGVERPDELHYDQDIRAEALRRRPELVRDALTVLRAHHIAGCPDDDAAAVGSFEEWNRRVRAAVIWVSGEDPMGRAGGLREVDPVRATLSELMDAWADHIGYNHPVSTAELIQAAHTYNDLLDPLLEATGDRKDLNRRRLGWWLRRHEGQIVHGRKIVMMTHDGHLKVRRWALVKHEA